MKMIWHLIDKNRKILEKRVEYFSMKFIDPYMPLFQKIYSKN